MTGWTRSQNTSGLIGSPIKPSSGRSFSPPILVQPLFSLSLLIVQSPEEIKYKHSKSQFTVGDSCYLVDLWQKKGEETDNMAHFCNATSQAASIAEHVLPPSL